VDELVAVGWGGMGLLVTVAGDKPACLTDAPARTGWLAEFGLQIRECLGQWREKVIAVCPRFGHERGWLPREHLAGLAARKVSKRSRLSLDQGFSA
jgi:hypothetical protein